MFAATLKSESFIVLYPTILVPSYTGIFNSAQSLMPSAIEPSIGPIVFNALVTFTNGVSINPNKGPSNISGFSLYTSIIASPNVLTIRLILSAAISNIPLVIVS